jgi:hypothetical protein
MNIAVEAATISVRTFMIWLLGLWSIPIGRERPFSSAGVADPQGGRRPMVPVYAVAVTVRCRQEPIVLLFATGAVFVTICNAILAA